MGKLWFGLIVMFLSSSASAGEIHKWTDEQGAVHFGDKPPVSAKTTEIILKPSVYAIPSVERNTTSLNSSTNTKSKSKTNVDVVMYSAEWCGYCTKARKYFTANNIPFSEYDIEKSRKGQRDYKKLKAKGVPVILVGNKRLNGFSKDSFESIYTENAPPT